MPTLGPLIVWLVRNRWPVTFSIFVIHRWTKPCINCYESQRSHGHLQCFQMFSTIPFWVPWPSKCSSCFATHIIETWDKTCLRPSKPPRQCGQSLLDLASKDLAEKGWFWMGRTWRIQTWNHETNMILSWRRRKQPYQMFVGNYHTILIRIQTRKLWKTLWNLENRL